MNKYIAIFSNDMKNTRRDPTLLVMLWLPLLMLALLRYGLPPLIELVPEIKEYEGIMVVFFAVLSAMFPSYIISFMLLDEKDQNVLTTIRIMPLTPIGFFSMRMLYMFLFGLINAFVILKFNGVMEISIFKCFLISLDCAVCSPIFVFLTISFAKNKIEGVTIMKVLNVLLILPLVGFFVDHPATYILGIIPFYWIFEAFESGQGLGHFLMFIGVGFLLAALLNILLYRLALRRFYLT